MTKKKPTPDRPPCDRCGEVHTKCTAHNRANKPCGRYPVPGLTVCYRHGGGSTMAREAGARKEADRKAQEQINKLWPGLAHQTPITDPVDLLARTAAALEQMTETVGDRINQNKTSVGAGKDMTQMRAEVVLLDRLLDKLLKASEGMARLGIAERHVELERARAELVTSAFRAALVVLSERVTLLPADRDLVLREFLDRLSPGSASTTAAGEVMA
ncbi:hypothetical protein [Nocardioides sp. LML1-1-1.1]|uniref:hypothetical protein n=1 Tax=Nocardioides sp. LML1-1-1.1 TaxID=3135248 RepID=UPI0034373751